MNPKRPFETTPLDAPVVFPSRDEIERHIARSRQLRAEATAAMLAAGGRTLVRPFRRQKRPLVGQPLARRGDQAVGDLDIAPTSAASGTDRGRLARWWHDRWARRAASRRGRRRWHRMEEELRAYQDHELDDLGIRRADIPLIVRGKAPAPAFE